MKKVLFLAVFALISYSVNGQNKSMEKAIKKTLEAYLDAGDQNDVAALDEHMHQLFRVALYDGKEGIMKVLDRQTYRNFVENKTFGGYPRTADYQAIQMIGENMASVQVILTSPGKPTLKNFYSLAKEADQWWVVQDFVTLIPN